MEGQSQPAEWYYVGHFGQLGPLTMTQMEELAADGVVTQETYVWKSGMGDWLPASKVPALKSVLGIQDAAETPPTFQRPTALAGQVSNNPRPSTATDWQYIRTHAPKSDRKRVLGGVLNFIPGIGRMYLGFAALGVLQLFVAFITCGAGSLWSWFDGIYILAGGVKFDGYGRRLED